MSINDFWHSDLSAYYIIAKAYSKKREQDIQDIDVLAWKIGDYLRIVYSSMPISTTLIMNKSILNKMPKYPQAPISLKDKIEHNEETPIKKRKINTTPPTPDEIAEYNRKMLMLRQK